MEKVIPLECHYEQRQMELTLLAGSNLDLTDSCRIESVETRWLR